MKMRPSLLLPLLLCLAACSGQGEAPAPAQPGAAVEAADTAPAASEATPAADAPAGTPAAGETTAGEPTAPAPAPQPPAGPAPVAGVDYIEIQGGQPLQPVAGKIEVAEVFGYTCPHCAQFEPLFQAWKRRQPADVNVISVPAPFGGYWTPYARAYYAAETLGVLERTHDATFAAIHLERKLPVGPNVKAEDLAPFYAKFGVDAKRFTDTYNSFGVDAKVNRARQFVTRAKVDGTPSLVVAGKYTIAVDQQGFEKMLRTAEWLVARERGGAN